jgi:hypothetical protein
MLGEEDNRSDVTCEAPAFAGADHQEVAGGRPAARRGPGGRCGREAARGAEQTLHRWRLQYGGLKADDAKRLKELERENARLKRIVADQLLENQALKEIARGNF